ncbi:MAG: hypothetical protein ACR2LT_00200 [Pyrinomonadaceae bacterium]
MMNLKAAGAIGSILALIALVIVLIKQIIAFIGFLTFAIKAAIFLVFAALFIGVGYMVFRTWSKNRQHKNNI